MLYQRSCSRQKVAVIAALVVPATRDGVRCYFRLAPAVSVDGRGVRAFLRPLRRAAPRPITLIWDRNTTHRREPTKSWLVPQRHQIRIKSLPPYAPELDPVELVWGYTKLNPIANCARPDLAALVTATRRGTHYVARRPWLLLAFLAHGALPLRLN